MIASTIEESEYGMQIVQVDASGSYKLDEEALAALLLRDEVADCRVALVSVAGAFRGGKSFLLDFMLRYLRAEEAARADGSWLGAEREELGGFNWRGGSERDTTGLLLWSRPARAALPSGEQVAVLLMDTQGTFDSHSTVRDCSTIFALSTLLSSVQIYNLKDNFREDDLQHLQLFSEYGKMTQASNDSKPFQTLNFLIRDWNYSYEHPYGAHGGKQLLEKRLKIDEEQAAELQELRQHLYSCFDSLDCFLMPHPGLAVFDLNFKGCLSDIREEFKESLLEFVPSILDTSQLKPKLINGHFVTGRDLFHYFRRYVEIFNSNELPEPQTIMRATAEAALLSAMESTRRQYHDTMEKSCGRSQPSMPLAMLETLHATARDAAIRAFVTRRNLGHRQGFRSSELTQELDDRLQNYVLLNDAKCQKALADAKRLYEERIQSICSIEHLCLHPVYLDEVQKSALEEAVVFFDSRRQNEGAEDGTKTELIQDIHLSFKSIRVLNEMNNKAAIVESREAYSSFMDAQCGEQPCMNIRAMELKHQEGNEQAMTLFASKRYKPCERPGDTYKALLSKDIEEKYNRIQLLNEINNRSALQAAITHYKGIIDVIIGAHLPCLHPDTLRTEHQAAREQALTEFHSRRRGDGNEEDAFVAEMNEEISIRFQGLDELNERKNNKAVNLGVEAYCSAMNSRVRPNRLQLTPTELMEVHRLAADKAIDCFRSKRRGRELHDQDRHGNNLTLRIDDSFMRYRESNEGNPLNGTNILMALGGVGALVAGAVSFVMTGGAAAAAAGGVVEIVQAGGGVALATNILQITLTSRLEKYETINENKPTLGIVVGLSIGAGVAAAGAVVATVATGGLAAAAGAAGVALTTGETVAIASATATACGAATANAVANAVVTRWRHFTNIVREIRYTYLSMEI